MRNTSEKTAIKLHIFDMDGTLLDSMRMWDNISSDYLRTKGIEPPENLASILDPMTFPEVCSYLAVNWNLGSPETVSREIARFLDHQYEEVLQLFPDAMDIIREAEKDKCFRVILSNSSSHQVVAAMGRLGILDYIDEIFTSETLGMRKDSPDIFRRVCRHMGAKPEETLVHDDSEYALKAAAEAVCMVKKYDRYR